MTAKPNGPAYPPGARLLANVTRLEVIDDTGRALTYPAGEPMEVELSFQDDDRTLKVFVRGRGHDNSRLKRELSLTQDRLTDMLTIKRRLDAEFTKFEHSVSSVLARMKWDLSRTPEGTKEHELLTLYTRSMEFALDPKAMG